MRIKGRRSFWHRWPRCPFLWLALKKSSSVPLFSFSSQWIFNSDLNYLSLSVARIGFFAPLSFSHPLSNSGLKTCGHREEDLEGRCKSDYGPLFPIVKVDWNPDFYWVYIVCPALFSPPGNLHWGWVTTVTKTRTHTHRHTTASASVELFCSPTITQAATLLCDFGN